MPEDEKLGLNEMLSQAAGNPPADPVPADPVPADPVPADPVPAEQVEDPLKPGFDTEGKAMVTAVPAPTPTPNPIKEVRDQLKIAKDAKELVTKTMNKFATGTYTDIKLVDHMLEDGTGIDYKSLSTAMETVDVATRATTSGLTPEVQAAVEQVEKDKIEIQKQRLQIDMDKALTNLQIDKTLKQADINNFFKDAMQTERNPYLWIAQGGSLGDLYNIIYADKIKQTEITAAVAAAKAEWDAAAAAAGKAPLPNPGIPVPGAGVNKDGMSMKDMLAEAAKKAK